MAYKRQSPIPIAEGGTNAINMATVDGTLYYDGNSLVTTSVGTSGWVLTSNGAGFAPTYQTVSSSGAVITETGNSGVATPSAGNINIVTSNSTPKFVGSGATLTLNFNATSNLALGSSLSALTVGTDNTAFGSAALTALTSGLENVAIGSKALTTNTTGSDNIAIGWEAGQLLNGGNGNVLIGGLAGSAYTGIEGGNVIIGTGITGTIGDNNTLQIATGATTAFIGGITGVTVSSPRFVTITAGGQLGSTAAAPLTVALGGTGDPSFTAFAPILAGTTTTGNFQSASSGFSTVGSVLTSTGSSSNPTWQTPAAVVSWSVITANQTAAVFNGYFCNKAGTLALALPAASAVGDIIEVANINTATGTQFTQGAGQQIFIGNTSTTSGATGTLTSSAVGDTLKIVCRATNLTWQVVSVIGNWSVA